MNIALLVSPTEISNHSELPKEGKRATFPVALTSKRRFTQKVIVLPKSEFHRAKDKIAQLEHDAHITLDHVARIVLVVTEENLDIIKPLAEKCPARQLVWFLTEEVFDEGKRILGEASQGSPNIIRTGLKEAPDKAGNTVESWLFEGIINPRGVFVLTES